MIRTEVRTKEKFLLIKQELIDTKQTFEYISSGSINFIKTPRREYKFINSKSNAGHGHHLSRMVKKDIDLWLTKNTIKPNNRDYKEQLFNLGNIERVVGDAVILIDINDCYWTTIYNLGYITEKTFKSGLKKKEWKLGRNASIGSLAKVSQVTPYKNGSLDKNKGELVQSRKEHQYIRNHIIGHVYNVFLGLIKILGADFFMFLTDCIVTKIDKKRLVEDYLASHGYKSKYKVIEFTKPDFVNKRINWHDFTAARKDANDVVIGKGKDKYYNYANHQLVTTSSYLNPD